VPHSLVGVIKLFLSLVFASFLSLPLPHTFSSPVHKLLTQNGRRETKLYNHVGRMPPERLHGKDIIIRALSDVQDNDGHKNSFSL
jgi:hypothetical protein